MRMVSMLIAISLAGCTTAVPIKQTFPSAPEVIMQACPNLELVPVEAVKMSEVLNIIVNNYTKYHECQIKQESWIEWYTSQKKIYEEK
mgnify:CR=1 FL=1